MKRILVWDIPTRLFHWLLAVSFLTAFGLARFGPGDSPLFVVHKVLGLTVAFMVALRIVWGFTGSRYARFRSFLFGPGVLLRYMRGSLTDREARYTGHNPGTAYMAFAMLLLLSGIIATGLLLGRHVEAVEEIHEALSYAMIGCIVLHLLGIALHTFRHRENIALSMITGYKDGEPGEGIGSPRPLVGLAFLFLAVFWGGSLCRNYDPAARKTTVPILGLSVPLGEGGPSDQKKVDEPEEDED
ncbi:MAG: cytochrome b/b6 domain-containing protein [Armatimonadetes bacterium]|nr:cytochrome b/b6 domain-containing protein [Armatimonadota bacterium]